MTVLHDGKQVYFSGIKIQEELMHLNLKQCNTSCFIIYFFLQISTTPNPKRKAEEDKKNAAKKKIKLNGGGGRGRKPK